MISLGGTTPDATYKPEAILVLLKTTKGQMLLLSQGRVSLKALRSTIAAFPF